MARRKAVRDALERVASVAAAEVASAAHPVGLGVDIVAIDRMRTVLQRSAAFRKWVFTDEERAYCDGTANPAAHYACRFAAREAVLKALGCGFGQGVGFHDVSVRRTPTGRPLAVLSGAALARARELSVHEIVLSLSFTHDEAVACAIAINELAVEAARKPVNDEEVIARQFKNARDVLDDLPEDVPDDISELPSLEATEASDEERENAHG